MAAGPYTILQELIEQPDNSKLEIAFNAPGLDIPLVSFTDYLALYQGRITPADLAPLYAHYGNATVERLLEIYHEYLSDGGNADYWYRQRGNIEYVRSRLR